MGMSRSSQSKGVFCLSTCQYSIITVTRKLLLTACFISIAARTGRANEYTFGWNTKPRAARLFMRLTCLYNNGIVAWQNHLLVITPRGSLLIYTAASNEIYVVICISIGYSWAVTLSVESHGAHKRIPFALLFPPLLHLTIQDIVQRIPDCRTEAD